MIDFWALIPAGLLLVLPGYALSLVVSRPEMAPLERVIVSIGLSMALIPVLLLWTTQGDLTWGGPTAWAFIVFSAIVSVSALPKGQGKRTRMMTRARQMINSVGQRPQYPLLALVFVASLALRLLVIRDINVPMWGDSLHHSWIARLISERGQMPDSFYPYFALDSLTYHSGYHAMVAFFNWTTGLPITRSILILSQIFNALSALTIYLLARKLTRSHVAALISALIVGLVSTMPAYYVNWGRYTQLTGQVILPVAVYLTMEAVERRHKGYLALAGIAGAGLFLTHYRVVLFYVAFMVGYLVWRALRQPKLRAVLADAGWLGIVGAASLLLAAPRVEYLAVNLPRAAASVPQLSSELWGQWMVSYNALGDVNFFLSWPLGALALAGLLVAIYKREQVGVILGIWVVLLFAMANAERLGLGRGGWLNNFAVLIALYMPASILIGWLGARLISALGRAWRPLPYVIGCLTVVSGLWGSWGLSGIADNQFALATPADERAMAWIRDHTPENSRFLVNFFFADGGKTVVGSDAGWWLTYLSGRQSTVPPILYAAESSPGGGYAAGVNAFARSISGTVYSNEGALLLREQDVNYIYIGEKGGVLDPNKLVAAGHQPVYHEGPVWVFRVRYTPGP